VASDGAVWFTEEVSRYWPTGMVGRMTTDGHISNIFKIGPAKQYPGGITRGPDGAIWFTIDSPSTEPDSIGRIGTDRSLKQFPLRGHRAPADIVTGPDGALWFPEVLGNGIGRMTTAGKYSEYTRGISPNCHPLGIALGSDGALWFTEYWANRVGRITTAGVVTEYSQGIPSDQYPVTIAAGPDGALWFTQYSPGGTSMLGRITTAGAITEFSKGIRSNYALGGIVAGFDNAMWFTEASPDQSPDELARMTMDGHVTEFSSPTSGASAIVAHRGGTLFFGLIAIGAPGIARATISGSGSAGLEGLTEP
jgi:virginiamycin B lyase